MEWVETTGRSVEEAKESALDELGVDEHDAEFEIVAQPRVGLFGRLRSEARVRARVRPTAPRAKDERRRKRRRGGEAAAGADRAVGTEGRDAAERGGGRVRTETTADRAATPNPGADRSDSNLSDATGAVATRSEAGGSTATSGATASAPSGNGRGGGSTRGTIDPAKDSATPGDAEPRRRRNRDRSGGKRPGEGRIESRGPAAATGTDDSEEEGQVEVALEEQAKVAEAFLLGLVAEMGIEATVTSVIDGEDSVELRLEGQELGLLIGPKGATLLALQDLTRTVVQRKTGASNGRLWVDVSGYRQKRAAALARFAQQVAAEVLASGARKAMEPMSAADRKVVHDTINEIPGVATLSEGEDANRRVVVYAVTD